MQFNRFIGLYKSLRPAPSDSSTAASQEFRRQFLHLRSDIEPGHGDQHADGPVCAPGPDQVTAGAGSTSWTVQPRVRDLRLALAAGEFALVYQPYVCARTGAVTGCEALLRWHHPVLGRVSPATFIPLAEKTSAIIPIGAWVLRTACREAAAWPEACRVSVNVSSVQLHAPGFATEVAAALQAGGIPASRLELELTEGVLIRDAEAAQACIAEIRALGVSVALDDFGTGFSSLSYLQHFTFDRVKIDHSFTKGLLEIRQSEVLVRAMRDIARQLGMSVTAEGVETEAEAALLREIGADELQGFLFSRPLDASAARIVLSENTRASDRHRPAPVQDFRSGEDSRSGEDPHSGEDPRFSEDSAPGAGAVPQRGTTTGRGRR